MTRALEALAAAIVSLQAIGVLCVVVGLPILAAVVLSYRWLS